MCAHPGPKKVLLPRQNFCKNQEKSAAVLTKYRKVLCLARIAIKLPLVCSKQGPSNKLQKEDFAFYIHRVRRHLGFYSSIHMHTQVLLTYMLQSTLFP